MLRVTILVLAFLDLYTAEYVTVKTKNGEVLGNIEKTLAGTTFNSFMGIPYAEPPIGNLRFQAPVAKAPWSKKVDATAEKGLCYQVSSTSSETEDCLHINVFSPAKNASSGLPVIFFIAGQKFIDGDSSRWTYGPEYLMNQDVIFVSFNYRLGPFGFLTTGDDVVPGNAGLKDQLLALTWTYENIQSFGGDPKKITIFGASGGAASVAYLSINPKAKGLYRAAIAASGTFLNPWAFQKKGKELSQSLAAAIDPAYKNDSISSQQLVKYLRSLPAKTIDTASFQINQKVYPSFVPTFEVPNKDAAITGPMFTQLANGNITNVPLLIGYNSEEMNVVLDQPGTIETYAALFDQNPTSLVPESMNIASATNKSLVGEFLKENYVPEGNFSTHLKNAIRYTSDHNFDRGIIKHASLQAHYGTVYFYRFAYKGVLGGYSKQSVWGFSEEVRHGEASPYIFNHGNNQNLSKFSELDQLVHRRSIGLITNFVKYLNPTPEKTELFQNLLWPKVDPSLFQYLDIGSYLELSAYPKQKITDVWEWVYSYFGIPPFITY